MKICLSILLMLFSIFGYSQNTIIKAYVYDIETGKPVSNANITIKGTGDGTVTNKQGFFRLETNYTSTTITITHVQYNDLTINTDTLNNPAEIFIKPSVNLLPEATVYPVKKVSSGMMMDVTDYCFKNGNLILTGYCYKYKKKKNPWIVMLSPKGDTVFADVIGQDGRLFKDCMNNLHYITSEYAYQLVFENDSIYFSFPTSTKEFTETMLPCILESNNKLLFGTYAFNDQMLLYFTVDKQTEEIKNIKTITNDAKLAMLVFQNHFFAMGAEAPSEADLRFEREMMYDSIFAPFIRTKDNLALINYVDSKIEWLDTCYNFLGDVDIDFHNNKFCQNELITDPVTGSVYAVYERNGKTMVQKISLQSGKTGDFIKIPDFKWIDNIKAYNGDLYFLYYKKLSNELRSLYKMNIN
jgi:hypothetical protein